MASFLRRTLASAVLLWGLSCSRSSGLGGSQGFVPSKASCPPIIEKIDRAWLTQGLIGALLEVDQWIYPDMPRLAVEEEYEQLLVRAKDALRATPGADIESVAKRLFQTVRDAGVTVEQEWVNPRSWSEDAGTVSCVLVRKRGNCTSLTMVVTCLLSSLGYREQGAVCLPGHTLLAAKVQGKWKFFESTLWGERVTLERQWEGVIRNGRRGGYHVGENFQGPHLSFHYLLNGITKWYGRAEKDEESVEVYDYLRTVFKGSCSNIDLGESGRILARERRAVNGGAPANNERCQRAESLLRRLLEIHTRDAFLTYALLELYDLKADEAAALDLLTAYCAGKVDDKDEVDTELRLQLAIRRSLTRTPKYSFKSKEESLEALVALERHISRISKAGGGIDDQASRAIIELRKRFQLEK